MTREEWSKAQDEAYREAISAGCYPCADAPCRHPHNVRIGRIGVVQGDPDRVDEDAGRPVPRFVKCSGPVCRDPGEADGRTNVRLLSDGESRWWKSVETVRLLKGDAPIQSQA